MAEYIKEKLKILRELHLKPTHEEIVHMNTLTNEIANDNCFIAIRNRRWREKYGDY